MVKNSNPNWTRDELILALDLYFREPKARSSVSHHECVKLSKIINSLPVYAGKPHNVTFRNANGIGMKLRNFLKYDPNYKGKRLSAGSRLEKEIWEAFAGDISLLKKTAEAIIANLEDLKNSGPYVDITGYDNEAEEGNVLFTTHKLRERSTGLPKRKKASVLKLIGALACEVCSFDFQTTYGDIGAEFAECHHIQYSQH